MDKIRKFYEAYKISNFPVDIRTLIKNEGIELREQGNLSDGITGQIERTPDDKFIITTNQDDKPVVRAYTMAHELGHYVFHRELIGQGVDDNAMYLSTKQGKYNNTNIKRVHEAQANIFACKTLMPILEVTTFTTKYGDSKMHEKPHDFISDIEDRFSAPFAAISWWAKIHAEDGELFENAAKKLNELMAGIQQDRDNVET